MLGQIYSLGMVLMGVSDSMTVAVMTFPQARETYGGLGSLPSASLL